jgi:hypothetical protein
MPKPLALTDDQMTAIQRAAEPLHPHDRGVYLERVAQILDGCEIRDGLVARAARQAQAELWRPPTIEQRAPIAGKWGRMR